jgi:glycosyltransferase involved in cell wall biosynthesis
MIKNNDVMFSVLLLSIPSRLDMLKKLYEKLHNQIGDEPVEVLTVVDNKAMSIGHKRNMLLNMARGKHLAFLDDDDDIADTYIKDILFGLRAFPGGAGPDVLTFQQHCTVNGKKFYVDFGLKNTNDPVRYASDGSIFNLRRKPYHMCVWKSAIAKNTPFLDISYGEDLDWIMKLSQRSKSEYHIDKVLHYYQYSDSTSESIQHAGIKN